MSDEEPRSGCRWEPAAAEYPRANADYATELHPTWTPPYLPPTTPSAAIPRSGKRRRAIAAAVGVGLLLIGGGAGYAIGHVTAATSGTPGTPGTFGHGRGGPGGFRSGDGAGFGGAAAGGAGTAGSGSTGAGSST